MQCYELTYLITPRLAPEQANDLSQRINSKIQEQGGILERTKRIEKINLGYQIKKKDQYFKTGFLCSLNFYLNPKKLKSLEQALKEEKEILRLSFFKKKPKKAPGISKKVFKRRGPVLRQKSKKVELKEIEEKIAEIIGE